MQQGVSGREKRKVVQVQVPNMNMNMKAERLALFSQLKVHSHDSEVVCHCESASSFVWEVGNSIGQIMDHCNSCDQMSISKAKGFSKDSSLPRHGRCNCQIGSPLPGGILTV